MRYKVKTFEIKGKPSTLLVKTIGIAGVWIGLLIFTDRSKEIIIPSLVGTAVVALWYIAHWIKSTSFSDYEIRIKTPFKTKVLKTNEITKIELRDDCYRLATLHDKKIDISIDKLPEEELRKLTKYFKH